MFFRCFVCDKLILKGRLCQKCEVTLPFATGTRCVVCANKLLSNSSHYCAVCVTEQRFFDRVICAFDYAKPVDQLIKQFKFYGDIGAAKLLGNYLFEQVKKDYSGELPALILPTPLHKKRLRSRGFNQSQIIACYLGKRLHVPVGFNHIRRIKNTAAQSQQPYQDRKQNLNNAYQLKNKIQSSHIALVDDVMTTGSTLNEMARIIKQNNSHCRVDIWVLARA